MAKKMIILLVISLFVLGVCSKATDQPVAKSKEDTSKAETENKEPETILIAAAASLENIMVDKLIPMFEEKNPGIKVADTYDSSGKLQTQIEEGLEADIFMSAATKQMNALIEENMIDQDSILNLLENKLILISSADGETVVNGFDNITEAEN